MERISSHHARARISRRSPAVGGILVTLALAGCTDETSSGTGGTGGTTSSTSSSSTESTTSTTTGLTEQPPFQNPAKCDDTNGCSVVPNSGGSNTLDATFVAQGATREITVGDQTATFHVSAYNGMIPGPMLEVYTTASDPANPQEADFLLINLTNGGDLNLCCWQDCGADPPESCWPSYCQGLNLQKDGPCLQADADTNIHTHGLHIAGATTEGGAADACQFTTPDPVSPDLPWDNIFLSIPATGMVENMSCSPNVPMCMEMNQQSFVYPLPPHATTSAFQPAPTTLPHWFGLEWYHPHMHPTTAEQVGRGMAGALIVRNPAETQIPALAQLDPDQEKILVLQRLQNDDQTLTARLVNGVQNPKMDVFPGETVRFRVLNATADNAVQIAFPSAADPSDVLPFYPIGFDGVPTSAIFPALETDYVLPGGRLEFLITVPPGAAEGDTYTLQWCEPKFDMDNRVLDPIGPNEPCTGATVTALTLAVGGSPVTPVTFEPGDAFADLPSFGLSEDLWDPSVVPAVQRTIQYTQDNIDFFLDWGDGPQMFSMEDMCNVPIATTLDTVEEWTLENYTGDLHTFHLHVNPFQVDPSLESPAYGQGPFYRDNILVPAGTGFDDPANPQKATNPGVVTMRVRLTDYVGTSVFHCHVLFHEDHGMMATFSTQPSP